MRTILLAAGLVLAAAAPASPEMPPAFSDAMEAAVEQGEIRAAVVGLLEDGVTRVYSFGRIGPANEQQPAGDTAFEIGSVTKVFTALLTQAQVQADRLDWDAPLSRYLEDVEFASQEALAGAGAMVSTANDLLRFIRENLDGEQQSAMLTAIREPQPNGNTALGWHLEPVEGDDRVYWHNGGTGGYASFLAFRPVNHTGLVILTASTEAQKVTQHGLAYVTGGELQADVDLMGNSVQ